MAARREGKSRRIKYQIVDRYSTIVAEEDRYVSFEEVPWSSFGDGIQWGYSRVRF